MRNRISNLLWGGLLVALGIGFFGNSLEWWRFDLFFDGWWTLFIILPCAFSIIGSGAHTGNLVGLGVGVFLLLNEQDILPLRFHQLILPVALVAVGLTVIFRRTYHQPPYQPGPQQNPPGAGAYQNAGPGPGPGPDSNRYAYTPPQAGKGRQPSANPNPFSILSGANSCFTGCEFRGGSCTAVLGGVELDLRGAIITQDVTISATAVLGGVDILVDDRVQVRYSSVPILGGLDCSIGPRDPALPTVYVNGVSVLGGIDIE